MFPRIILRNLGFKRPTLTRSTAKVSNPKAGMEWSSRQAYETLNTQVEKLGKRAYAFSGIVTFFISVSVLNCFLDNSIERKFDEKMNDLRLEVKAETKKIHVKLASLDVKLASLEGKMQALLAIFRGKGGGGSTVA